MVRLLFSAFCVGMEKFSLPHKRKCGGSCHARLHDVVIKKVIDGNLTVLGNIPQRIPHISSGQNNWRKKTLADKVSPAKSSNVFTAKVLSYTVY